jgi:hypothetical protein
MRIHTGVDTAVHTLQQAAAMGGVKVLPREWVQLTPSQMLSYVKLYDRYVCTALHCTRMHMTHTEYLTNIKPIKPLTSVYISLHIHVYIYIYYVYTQTKNQLARLSAGGTCMIMIMCMCMFMFLHV